MILLYGKSSAEEIPVSKHIYINAGDTVQHIKCFDEDVVGPVKTELSNCPTAQEIPEEHRVPCPNPKADENGILELSGFASQHTGAIITCSDSEKETELLLVIVTPPVVDAVHITYDTDLPQHVDFDEDLSHQGRPKQFIEYALCYSGYSYPGAVITWRNADTGGDVQQCSGSLSDMSGCELDKDDSKILVQKIMPLNFELNNGEYKAFECTVVYKVALDGELIEKSQTMRVPETGYFTYGDYEIVDTPDVVEVPKKETSIPDEHGGSPDNAEEQPEEHASEDVEDAEMGNALLGTASGFIILAIIIALIFFVRKRAREQREEDAQYKAGSMDA